MGIPNVRITKSSQGGSPALQTSDGILAIIASSSTGTASAAGIFTNQAQLTSAFGLGPLPEYGTYEINVSGRPVVAIKATPSIAATYSTITSHITGTATVVAGATAPYEHYAPVVTFVNGGTLGTSGITFTYSLDGGNTTSGVQALGTSTTLTIPNSGVSFTLSVGGSGTIVAADSFSCFTERPLLNNSDLTTSLNVLNQTRLPWEGVLADCAYNTGTVGLLDTWCSGREANGQFNFFLINTRYLTEPTPTGESPSAYTTAMTALTSADASDRGCVGADGGHVVSLISGLNLKRPTALALAGMAMSLTPNIGISPSFVGNGPVTGFQISSGGNPNDWDEAIYGPALDPLRLVTLRSFAPGGPTGCYITNPNVLVTSATDSIKWIQLLRVMNKGCTIAWQVLATQLNRGVHTVLNSNTGKINIDERDAQSIEHLVNSPLQAGLSGQVTGVSFSVNRDDDLSVQGSPLSAEVQIAPLFYIGGFQVQVALVKSITAPATVV